MDDWTEKIIPDDCAFLKSNDHQFDLNDDPLLVNRRLYVKIKVESGLLTSNLKGTIKNYRKVGGKYKPKRASLKMVASGSSYNGDCVLMPQYWSKTKDYAKKKKRKANARIWTLWREAFVDWEVASWSANACVAHGYWDNDNKYYPVALFRD